ncbi:MAG: type II secretion system protein, partial [Lachnospiraceae bacterium]|nr:type II secretion system protein [Lachnospiraceae bacterium]
MDAKDMEKQYGSVNKNAGFTLLEMIAVITVIAISMSVAVWAVMGWIAHYEYTSSEEKAKIIYMGAQSALSAAESRGTLDEYMEQLKGEMTLFSQSGEGSGPDKATYGIPTKPDNEGNEHEYGYLAVRSGDYQADPDKKIFDLLRTYVSETEQLNGSIVLEFDLTAGKVYSAFYSTWADSISYGAQESVVRGDFYIIKERRTPEYREDYAVGYYAADQVNVVQLARAEELRMKECQLHNEETLHLTMSSTSVNADADTQFTVQLYDASQTGMQPALQCSFSVDRSMLGGAVDQPRLVQTQVTDADGNSLGDYAFVLSFDSRTDAEGAEEYVLSLTLDALSTGQTMALMKQKLESGRTDKTGYSITRLLGTSPRDIFARVLVQPKDSLIAYATGPAMDSNVENDLFATKVAGSSFAARDDVYEIARCRHLSNIRYMEQYASATDRMYALTEDLDWKDGVIYDPLKETTGAVLYASEDTTKTGFPMIPKLGEKSVFDGQGNQITGLLITNESGALYRYKSDGTLTDPAAPVNVAKTLGLFGTNRGTVQRLIFSEAKVTALSAAQHAISGQADTSVYADSLEAVGILCGRNEGYCRELYFDKECAVKASVFANLRDEEEAVTAGMEHPANEPYLNQMYGCGVGMVAGTAVLKAEAVFDRIRTAGSVDATISGTAANIKDAPAVTDIVAREMIYDHAQILSGGKTNADYYAYGVGGLFGYVYGEYQTQTDQLGIGISGELVAANKGLSPDAQGGYLPMYRRIRKQVTETDAAGNQVTVYKLVKSTKEEDNLFGDWQTQSIMNKADVKGAAFTGGIVGNLYISGKANSQIPLDAENDPKIPDDAVAHLLNCHNYGDSSGSDFVGGIVGVNGEGGYIKDCVSYGSPSAGNGVAAGIASENYGYMSKCVVDRAKADADHADQAYIPKIEGNMLFAGIITSTNHKNSIVYQCRSAVTQLEENTRILISGKEMHTFGFLVGENDGVVDGGRSGIYLGYESPETNLIIGGAVGINNSVVKNVTVMFDLADTGHANCIGGVVGENLGVVKRCRFGGNITKLLGGFAGTKIGGIVAINGSDTRTSKIKDCYLIGSTIRVGGACNFVETNSEVQKLSASSAVGGICGYNDKASEIEHCYLTSLCTQDGQIRKQSTLTVKNGMVGGIAAVNLGKIAACGYTDKVFYEDDAQEEWLVATEETKDIADMAFADQISGYLGAVSSPIETTDANGATPAQNAVNQLNQLFLDEKTGSLTDRVKAHCGYLPAPGYRPDQGICVYALPQKAYDEGSIHIDPYDAGSNHCVISLDEGKGYVGGIAGFNGTSGQLNYCASGKWLVENYLPAVKYNAIGGVIGENTAGADKVSYNVNFAYVRNELAAVPNEGNVINDSSQVTSAAYDRNFYYVGGVVGTQNNTLAGDWTIEKCINAGTVLNYYGNNAGGVIAQVKGMGGTVQYCFNYGTLMTGYTTTQGGGYSGAAGGIVAHYTELKPDQVNNVLHCQNHGVVGFPMQGLEYETNIRRNKMGGMTANDVGGVVGMISAPQSKNMYTVNIIDCVNGVCARVYSYSTDAGILGKVGGYIKDGVQSQTSVNSIFINMDSCRNYTSHIWNFQGITRDDVLISYNSAGIFAGRQKYDTSVPKVGYSTIQNCFSVKMLGFAGNGSLRSLNGGKVGKITDFKINTLDENLETFRYCGNNYYVDEVSFQYNRSQGRIRSGGFVAGANNSDIANQINTYVCAFVSEGRPATITGRIDETNYGGYNQKASKNNLDELSLRLGADRLIAVAYGDEKKQYAFAVVPYEYDTTKIGVQNAWIEGTHLYVATQQGDLECPIVYRFGEQGDALPYNMDLLDHFYFENVKRTQQSAKADATRLPFADEYDVDYFALDCAYMKFIKESRSQQPDIV